MSKEEKKEDLAQSTDDGQHSGVPSQESVAGSTETTNSSQLQTERTEASPQQQPAIQRSTLNIQHNKEMEVHHHGHVHEKKKWKEYLFQFLMLFLAVFCGFLAEYQLEHTIEHNREKQFIRSLVKDLQLDTAQLVAIERYRVDRLKKIDSIISFFVIHSSNTITLRQYKNIRQIAGGRGFYSNTGTIDQLKNSGGLRLIRKRNVVDSIEAYDAYVNRMSIRDRYEIDLIDRNMQIVEKLVDGRALLKIHADTTFYKKLPPSLETPFSMKPEYVGEYLNQLYNCRWVIQANHRLQTEIKIKAINLILLIKEEYHLK